MGNGPDDVTIGTLIWTNDLGLMVKNSWHKDGIFIGWPFACTVNPHG